MFNYTSEDLVTIKSFNCYQKKKDANARFADKIATMDVLNLLKRFGFSCAYCNSKLNPNKWQLDHFYARCMGGKNSIENLCPSCHWCNQMKRQLDGFAFIYKCRKISENNLIEKMFGELYK